MRAPQSRTTRVPRPAVVVAELVAALGIAGGLVALHAGSIAWLLSGVLSGWLVLKLASRRDPSLMPNRRSRRTGQALIGLAMGFSLNPDLLARVLPDIPLLLALVAGMIATGVVVGLAYAATAGVDLGSALYATMPGGAGIMASVAAERDRDTSLVAIIQASRIVAVVVTIPVVIGLFGSGGAHGVPGAATASPFSLHTYLAGMTLERAGALVVLGVVVLGVVIGLSRLRLPVAPLFGALAVGLVAALALSAAGSGLDARLAPPDGVHLVGQVLLGLTIGEYLGKYGGVPARTLLLGLGSVAATILAGLGAALVAFLLTSWSALTCVLVTAPGGAAEMLAIASALGGRFEVVTVGQLFRQLAINGLLPLWILLFARLELALQRRRALRR